MLLTPTTTTHSSIGTTHTHLPLKTPPAGCLRPKRQHSCHKLHIHQQGKTSASGLPTRWSKLTKNGNKATNTKTTNKCSASTALRLQSQQGTRWTAAFRAYKTKLSWQLLRQPYLSNKTESSSPCRPLASMRRTTEAQLCVSTTHLVLTITTTQSER
jgi:hypothetical protein